MLHAKFLISAHYLAKLLLSINYRLSINDLEINILLYNKQYFELPRF